MRRSTTAIAVAVMGLLVAGCGETVGNAESPTTTRSMIPRPLVARELTELLLSPGEVDGAFGAVGMTVTSTQTEMSDNSATMAPRECLAIDGAAEAPVYSDSGFWAERDQSLNDGDHFLHYLKQAVVLFPIAEKAGDFVDASAQEWTTCHEYTHTQTESQWSVGQIVNANDTLSITHTRRPSW